MGYRGHRVLQVMTLPADEPTADSTSSKEPKDAQADKKKKKKKKKKSNADL